MSSQIIRAPRPEVGYTVIQNEVLRDNRLSYRDRGLLAYMLSHTDNWRFNVEKLATQGIDGKQALYTAMKNLEQAGYITRRRTHNKETGKFDWETTIYDTPQQGYETPVTQNKEPIDPLRKQASHLVTDIWEPATKGIMSQHPAGIVKVVENALRNGISAPRCAKALAQLAATKTTVSQYQFDLALNGKATKGQLTADKKQNWAQITNGSTDGTIQL